jgi:ankyrin repeat protein
VEIIKANNLLLHHSLSGWTWLHYCVWLDLPKFAGVLLDMGIAVDDADRYGNTPLMDAFYRRNETMARLLLKHGASKDVVNQAGTTLGKICAPGSPWESAAMAKLLVAPVTIRRKA